MTRSRGRTLTWTPSSLYSRAVSYSRSNDSSPEAVSRRRTFDERGPHSDNQVADAEIVEGLEQRALSRGEDDVEHW